MGRARHADQKVEDGIHIPYAFEYADATARQNASGLTSDDVGKFARQTDNDSVWMLTSTSPTWVEVTNISASAAVNKIDIKTIAASGVSISKGDVLYLVGHDDANQAVIADKAKADADATMPAFGIANESISDSSTGQARVIGKVFNLDTSSYSVGDVLHVSASTAGEIVGPAPSGPNIAQAVGEVLKSDASSGIVWAKIETFVHLSDADPKKPQETPDPGTATRASRADHVHPEPARVTIPVWNSTGSTLQKGKAVYVSGYNATEDLLTADLADKDDENKNPAHGLALNDIPDQSEGEILIRGALKDVDTSAFSLGWQLVLSNNGDLERHPPHTATNSGALQNIAAVSRADAAEGQLSVQLDGKESINIPETQNVDRTYSTGLLSGGALSHASGLDVDIASGEGFAEDSNDDLQFVTWSNQTVSIPADTNQHIYIDDTGTAQTSLLRPDLSKNIMLGTAEAGGSEVQFIARHRVDVTNQGVNSHTYRREAIGSVAIEGVKASINGSITTRIDVSSGDFVAVDSIITTSGAQPITFTYWWRDGSGGWEHSSNLQDVDLTQYDDGSGTLASIPGGKVKADRLFVGWDGTSQHFHLIYGQELFDSASEATGANLNPPTSIQTFGLRIAECVIVEGASGINSINDIRPFVGQNQSPDGDTGVSDHGLLSGLDDDDHILYLRTDGTRSLTGNLDIGSNFIENMSGIDHETGTAAPSYQEGRVFYDDDAKALAYYNDETAVSLQIGQEQYVRVYNNSGSVIGNGKAVYITGADPTTELPTVALAKANVESTAQVIGLATHEIGIDEVGYITIQGTVNGLDTSAFANGSQLFLSSSTAGELTTTEPAPPDFNVKVGFVEFADSTNGQILVDSESPTVGDGFVLVSSNDTDGRPLEDKVVGGTAITTTTLNDGSDEDLEVDVGTINDTQHGDRGGGSLHSNATPSTDGFLASTDKSKLDGIEANAKADQDVTAGDGLTGGGTGDVTLDVAAADGSIVVNADNIQVGTINDTQHGDRGGGSLHATATQSTAGFMGSADKTKLDALGQTSQATGTTTITTTSTSYVQMSGMSLTPGAGTYLVMFSTSVLPPEDFNQLISLYVAGSQVIHTERQAQTAIAAHSDGPSGAGMSFQTIETLTGGQTLDVRWRVTGGTGTTYERTLTLVRIS